MCDYIVYIYISPLWESFLCPYHCFILCDIMDVTWTGQVELAAPCDKHPKIRLKTPAAVKWTLRSDCSVSVIVWLPDWLNPQCFSLNVLFVDTPTQTPPVLCVICWFAGMTAMCHNLIICFVFGVRDLVYIHELSRFKCTIFKYYTCDYPVISSTKPFISWLCSVLAACLFTFIYLVKTEHGHSEQDDTGSLIHLLTVLIEMSPPYMYRGIL